MSTFKLFSLSTKQYWKNYKLFIFKIINNALDVLISKQKYHHSVDNTRQEIGHSWRIEIIYNLIPIPVLLILCIVHLNCNDKLINIHGA